MPENENEKAKPERQPEKPKSEPTPAGEPRGGDAPAKADPAPEGETKADEVEAPATADGAPPLGEPAREDEGQNSVRVGDTYTDASTGEQVQVTAVDGDEATVVRGNGDEQRVATNVLATTWRHDGPSHGWGEGVARD